MNCKYQLWVSYAERPSESSEWSLKAWSNDEDSILAESYDLRNIDCKFFFTKRVEISVKVEDV